MFLLHREKEKTVDCMEKIGNEQNSLNYIYAIFGNKGHFLSLITAPIFQIFNVNEMGVFRVIDCFHGKHFVL